VTRTLFSDDGNAEVVRRIQSLAPGAKREWGKMDVAQMLAHCQAPFRITTGEDTPPRRLLGMLFGRMALRTIIAKPVPDHDAEAADKPLRRNLPTDRSFAVRDRRDFAQEQQGLITLVRQFGARGPGGIGVARHPFFGRLSAAEWDTLMWKHLDHHLRQFGA